MAYTVTWPRELKNRVKKQVVTARPAGPAAAKGPLGRMLARVCGVLAEAFRSPEAGEQGLRKGASGEQAVAEELNRLPDGWFIVNDLRVGGSQIDHIVLGPNGIFCLETKHSGTVRIDEAGHFYRLENRMWVPVNSPAVQNMRHIRSLKRFLAQDFDFHPRIGSVVAYVGQGRYELETLTVPPGHTKITFSNNLREYLLMQPSVSWDTRRLRTMAFALAGLKET